MYYGSRDIERKWEIVRFEPRTNWAKKKELKPLNYFLFTINDKK